MEAGDVGSGRRDDCRVVGLQAMRGSSGDDGLQAIREHGACPVQMSDLC